MKKPKDKIEELFQSHIDDFDRMPDDSLWADIEAHLPPVVNPVHRLWRWGLAAALLLFSGVGYVVYQSLNTRHKVGVVGVKENTSKNNTTAQKLNSKKEIKTASETNESNLAEEYPIRETKTANEVKNDKSRIAENKIQNDKITRSNLLAKSQNDRTSINRKPVTKSAELLAQKENLADSNKNQISKEEDPAKQMVAIAGEDSRVENNQAINEAVTGNKVTQNAITEEKTSGKLSDLHYLANHGDRLTNAIPLNIPVTYESGYQAEEKKESFFKAPTEVYVSLTPSLNYYRVFSNAHINQFNGANNGGRVGWAVQAGAVYPLKFRKLSYRVGLSYFSAQSNFKYNLLSGRQQPIRLDNNTFEYVNIESPQTESKKWQVLEIQNDLMYKVRPMQDLIMGFKAGSSFTEKPVFDAYMGYRFSKQVSHRQILWIEAAYAYAINAQKSSNNTFSYHMDKYSMRVGLNFR